MLGRPHSGAERRRAGARVGQAWVAANRARSVTAAALTAALGLACPAPTPPAPLDASPAPAPTAAPPSAPTPSTPKGPFLPWPEKGQWITNIDKAEQHTFVIQKVPKKKVCAAVTSGRIDDIRAQLAPGFMARLPGALVPLEPADPKVITAEARLSDAVEPVDAEAYLAATRALRDEYALVERCLFKPYQVLTAKDEKTAWLRLHLGLGGRAADGSALEHSGEARLRMVQRDGHWLMERLEIEQLASDRYLGTSFVDVSSLAGVGLFRSPEKQAAILRDLGNIAITNLGGLDVIDWNDDGAPDLLAYNLESLFSVFVNDGRGGFGRVPQDRLIPHEEAALFYLWLDLDGDGRRELIGTRPRRCGGGKASIPIHRIERGRLVDTKRALEYASDCKDRFIHIAAHDLDRDGKLDLFFSAYGDNRDRSRHNLTNAMDGARNRLFMNRGKLSFADETDARGIGTETRTSYIGHWFDLDDDGDEDLIVINDFARNEVYLAEGGRLVRTELSPITDNGFSMGISVADYDLDGDFDLHVSNMFSYAGNRILAVTDKVEGAEREMLLAMARGNTMYRNDGGGKYSEVASELGINVAKWAWGNALFDADNDGDRDIHVTNGYNSNPEGGGDAPDN